MQTLLASAVNKVAPNKEGKNSMLLWDSKSQALEYQSIKISKGLGSKAMEDMIRLNRENNKFKYYERSKLFANKDQDEKQLPDKQAKVHFEDISTLDVRAYEPKIFTIFENECKKTLSDLKAYIEYSGGHQQGERQGYGCEFIALNGDTSSDRGDFYCGGWMKGLRHGPGICYYADGSVYKGAWADGEWCGRGASGVGMYRTVNGEILVGTFTGERGNLKDLQWAQIKYPNGDIYSGILYKGKK
jgi:hypothetical protein